MKSREKIVVRVCKYVSLSILSTKKILLEEDVLLIIGWYRSMNWGDALNSILIQELSGRTPLIVTRHTYNVRNKPVYSVIGSVLGSSNINNNNCGNKNLIVWGSGFISNLSRLKVPPNDICAVRGPLTRKLL